MDYDCIVIGAGPAGLTAAASAARAGLRTLVLDKSPRPGTKLLLAGGGKGNVTNRHVSPADYVGERPGFAGPVLDRLSPAEVMSCLEAAAIPLEERDHGRIFCRCPARGVLDLLLADARGQGVRLQTGAQVAGITRENGVFTVTHGRGKTVTPRLILATGSPAWPQSGADDSGLVLARSLGHRIIPPRPVLVPLVMPTDWPLSGLTGISLPVRIGCDVADCPVFEDSLLFTHKGLSGPAALQASCYWRKGSALTIDFLPGKDMESLLREATGKATPLSVLGKLMPQRLAAALLPPDLATRRTAELSRKNLTAVADAVHRHTVTPLRTEGMKKAEAAAGGVDTAQVDPYTLQSLVAPGLFLCGEALDVTGRLGGYNLHWAWASGRVAGQSAGG